MQALLVNPYCVENVAAVLHRALQMPEAEREVRMSCLRAREARDDVEAWMRSFMDATQQLMVLENGK